MTQLHGRTNQEARGLHRTGRCAAPTAALLIGGAACAGPDVLPPLFLDFGLSTDVFDVTVDPRTLEARFVGLQWQPNPNLPTLWSLAPGGELVATPMTFVQTPGYEYDYLGGARFSDDGTRIVSSCIDSAPCPGQIVVLSEQATWWMTDAPGAPQGLGFLVDLGPCAYSVGKAIADDGTIAGGNAEAGGIYRWTETEGWIALPGASGVPGETYGSATDISASGGVITGWTLVPPLFDVFHPARWDESGCTILETPAPVWGLACAFGVSPDGQILAGSSDGTGLLWVQGAVTPIPPAPDATWSFAYDVTNEGYVIGDVLTAAEVYSFIWHPSWPAPQSIGALFADAGGGTIPTVFEAARLVSAGGSLHVVGHAMIEDEHGQSVTRSVYVRFPAPPIAVPGDLDGDGLVTGSDLGLLLSAYGSADPSADLDGDGVVDGSDLGILLAAWSG
ncbi:MAG: hypothetical protein KDA22_04530 [Phycisphaerales bacterium]|nr:hypothetical protein [Phycisphaerales bacterium]